jgi:hypothetical protein
MNILLDNEQLCVKFKFLCKQYDHFEWAVAWAGNDFEESKLLGKYSDKIDKLIVGLHFYQTHPNFIRQYMEHPRVRFNPQTNDLFHSKIYLFYNTDQDWAAIIGSSNFTDSAFHKNYEANVLVTSSDSDAIDNYKRLRAYIAEIWDECKSFTKEDLKAYERCYQAQASKHDSLKMSLKDKDKAFNTAPIQLMEWSTFYEEVIRDPGIEARLSILDKAQKLLSHSFCNLTDDEKRCLAGLQSDMPEMKDVDWKYFGSMTGAGNYSHAIVKDLKLQIAIDIIPINGKVTKDQFDKYCSEYKKLYKNPLGCATRLLAMKRPDLFVCVDSKNKTELCKAFAIPESRLTIDNYWDLIVEPLQKALWVNSKLEGANPRELKVKKYQIALLDSLYYKGK